MATITTYNPGAPSSALHAIWAAAFPEPAYALPPAKLHALLNHPSARVLVACLPASSSPSSSSEGEGEVVGWALTYTIRHGTAADPGAQHARGGLALLLVHPAHRRAGVGSALHAAALAHLEEAVRANLPASTPVPKEGSIQLGSAFPRVFLGVPSTHEAAVKFFGKRGWTLGGRAIDLYGRLPTGVDLTKFTRPAEEKGVVFRGATGADREAVMRMEYAEFGAYCGWPDLVAEFFDSGHAADVHLALRDGQVIGATIAAMPGSPVHARLAWPDVLGAACGAIACVGVSAAARGTGAGVGLTAAAMAELERRGADGVFIDWVDMVGFYERFGVRGWAAPYVTGSRVVAA